MQACRRGVRLISRAVFVVPLLVWAATASAGWLPSPAASSVPTVITLVGRSGGTADPAGLFRCVIRDPASNPMGDVYVIVDLSAARDLFLCGTPGLPALEVDAAHRTVAGWTNSLGQRDFLILGNSHGVAQSDRGTVHLYADGVLISRDNTIDGLVCTTPDLDGDNGLGANDIAALLSDIGAGSYRQRADLDGSGGLGANDIAVMLQAIGRATSVESCP